MENFPLKLDKKDAWFASNGSEAYAVKIQGTQKRKAAKRPSLAVRVPVWKEKKRAHWINGL